MAKIIEKVKAKVAYEKESFRMSAAELERLRKEHPDTFRKGK